MNFNTILIVCVGNICRSPTGSTILQTLLPNKTISSAGLKALVGKPAAPESINIAKKHGYCLEHHIAQQATRDLCYRSDLILTMERAHTTLLCQNLPEVRGKTMLFGHWINEIDIGDPYRKSNEAYEHTFSIILQAANQWAKVISSNETAK